jgi:Ala-tRNA(Pro) deacylase
MEQYLHDNGVAYEVLAHAQAYTMPEVAAALHITGKQVAKTVIVKAGGSFAMVVVPSPARVDFAKVSAAVGEGEVRLAHEGEFADLFPDCAVGAMPPFGNLYEVPVYVDSALAEQESIVFRVGSHRHTMKVAYNDFAALVEPQVGDFVLNL